MNILITGTTSGLGQEIFNELKKDKKNKFFLISRNLKLKNNNIKSYNLDLSNYKMLNKKIKQILKDSKNKIDLIICNAAQGVFGNIDEIKMSEYKKDFDVNFFSHLLIIKTFIPFMKKQKYGHIINISSGAAIVGLEKSSSYSTSKSCMQTLIESIHPELIKHNIYSKNIFPGPTKTNFFKKNKYIKHKISSNGKSVKKIAAIIVKNLFKKKINIFCQKKTMASYIIKAFPGLR